MTVATASPAIFTADSSGTGPGPLANADGSINGPDRPAAPGETIVIYATGERQTTPAGVTGQVTTVSSAPPLTPLPLLPVSARIAGQPAEILFAGEAPGFCLRRDAVEYPDSGGGGVRAACRSLYRLGEMPSQDGVTVSVR